MSELSSKYESEAMAKEKPVGIESIESVSIPKWSSDLRTWREEHGCTGTLWDAYAGAAEQRVKYVRMYFYGLGIISGVIIREIFQFVMR